MLSRWFLCFLYSSHCFSLVPMLFHNKTFAFSLVPMCFAITPMLFHWCLCFSHKPQLARWFFFLTKTYAFPAVPMLWFFFGSYVSHSKAFAFSLVPMLFTLAPMLFCCFLCFPQSNLCFFCCSYAFRNQANVLILGSYVLYNKTCAFSLVPMFLFNVKPMFFPWLLCLSH